MDAFREMRHWGENVPPDVQREIYEAVGEEWFHSQLSSLCGTYTRKSAAGHRLADKLQQRWRKAGLVTYGDGKWYRVKS